MSQPKRYSLVASYYCSDAKMKAFEDGEFVRHADYAALQAENERLRKAGDAFLGAYLFASSKGFVSQDTAVNVIEEWSSAKGVQS